MLVVAGVAAGMIAVVTIGSAVAASSHPTAVPTPQGACTPQLDRDASAAPPAQGSATGDPTESTPDGSGAHTDTISVQVPEGRLYLDPDRLVVPVSHGEAAVPATFLADLRDARPGWTLSATLVSILVDGHAARGRVTIRPTDVAAIVGRRTGITKVAATTIGPGECASLLVARAGAGWGSYREGSLLQVTLEHERPADHADVVLQLHLS